LSVPGIETRFFGSWTVAFMPKGKSGHLRGRARKRERERERVLRGLECPLLRLGILEHMCLQTCQPNYVESTQHVAKRYANFNARSQNCEKRLLASACLSIRMEYLISHWKDFHKILIFEYFSKICRGISSFINPLNPELNPICYLLHVSRIRVKLLTFSLLMSYIYGAPILDVSRSHTTTQHSR